MAKEIIIWLGDKWKLRKGETVKDIVEQMRDGEIITDLPDYIKITDIRGNTLLKRTNY